MNKITKTGAIALGDAMKKGELSRLKVLDLESNPLGEEGIKGLA